MTQRLYYEDAYLTEFSARVLECRPGKEGFEVRLDRSAFYPTSGGQPYDTGRIEQAKVLDVWVDGQGEVWHRTDAALPEGGEVRGRIDWARRFDHMQQHAGEHMLAGVIWNRLRGITIGLHLGAQDSTIDVTLPDGRTRISDWELEDIEDRVNAQIQRDYPIRCYFPTPEELKNAPLRKPPTVTEHVRLVQVGDVECVACGGTHPSSSGQIGLIRILDIRPNRGKMRVFFVCGMRAVRDYRQKSSAARQAAALLSTGTENLALAVGNTLEKLHQAQYDLRQARLHEALEKVDALARQADVMPDGLRVVQAVLTGFDRDTLRESAAHLAEGGTAALLASGEDSAPVVFAFPEASGLDAGQILSLCMKQVGGAGGGRGSLAQGAGPGGAALRAAMALLAAKTANGGQT